ncbi:MAG: hypothetical protein V2J55_02105 [Candidatus Competibacteraceae bacterium]|jgi:hypothetical protein|nr:hypothetical protein [Candidatus Competibacteraceae bacterium]
MPNRSVPSLSEVQSAFDAWRQRGRPRITPEELRRQAVDLLADHSIRSVQNALRLDHRRLSRWRREFAAAPALPTFVEIPALTPEPATSLPTVLALTLTRYGSDGRRVSIQGELDATHWRWALELLEAGS